MNGIIEQNFILPSIFREYYFRLIIEGDITYLIFFTPNYPSERQVSEISIVNPGKYQRSYLCINPDHLPRTGIKN